MASIENTPDLWQGVHKGRFAGLNADEMEDELDAIQRSERHPFALFDAEEAYGGAAIRCIEPTYDLERIAEAILEQYDDEYTRQIRGVDQCSTRKEQARSLAEAISDEANARDILSWLSHEEMVDVRALLLEHRGRVRYTDDSIALWKSRHLPLVQGWVYVFRYDSIWDFIVPDQMQRIGRRLDWDRLVQDAEANDRIIDIADVLVECFGAVSCGEFLERCKTIDSSLSVSWDCAATLIRRAAKRGRNYARVVVDADDGAFLVHRDIIRSAGHDAPLLRISSNGEKRNRRLRGLISECVANRSGISEELAGKFDNPRDYYLWKVHCASGRRLEEYLNWHEPDDAESPFWSMTTFGLIADRSRRTRSVDDLLDTLARRGVVPPGGYEDEIRGILGAFLGEMPHWGCEISCPAEGLEPWFSDLGCITAPFPLGGSTSSGQTAEAGADGGKWKHKEGSEITA